MPRDVRVGDTVSLQLAGGNIVTADVTVVTDQDDIDVTYHHHDEAALLTTVLSATRATSFPATEGDFWKMA